MGDLRLKGVGQLAAGKVICNFTESSLDLKVVGLDGKNHRFLKTNLEKEIVPAESTVKVEKNHVSISLQKVKGEDGYDQWSDLCAKGKRTTTATKKDADPSAHIIDMTKDLYDFGEATNQAKRGEKYEPKAEDMKAPGCADDV